EEADIAIIEVGGTVGDIESLPFLEALRQLKIELGKDNAVSVHVTLVPFIEAAGELKTKPTQHAVREMREIGIQPDILICRAHEPLGPRIKEKIALFCNVPVECVVSGADVKHVYELPLAFHAERLDEILAEKLNIWSKRPDLSTWRGIVRRVTEPQKGTVKIGVVGKYVKLKDAYKSLNEALVHGGMANDVKVELEHIDSEDVERLGPDALFAHLDAILVPGGFGDRGTEGKIATARYAREKGVPFFGICLGMQLAVVEFARSVVKLDRANSTEFDRDTPHPVIDLMLDQRSTQNKGGTMRLGAYPCTLAPGTLAAEAYGATEISERHRHRFEFNNAFRERLAQAGLVFSGTSPDGRLVEMIELSSHPYFVACQFHPEFKSRPVAPHPLFSRFVRAGMERRDLRAKGMLGSRGQAEATPAN
ncbi:MAG: CTP synthase, partial [Polyangiaceae bacterium]|nr:CTP synthase [Polyangiaceae bacterium]